MLTVRNYGILAAIAIPIFANIQKNANDAAGQSAAANAASSAAIIASQTGATQASVTGGDYSNLVKAPVTGITVKITGTDLSTLCATAAYAGGNHTTWSAGPAVVTAADGSTSCP
jgi:type II secretory pathway pseudopilin PulG